MLDLKGLVIPKSKYVQPYEIKITGKVLYGDELPKLIESPEECIER